MSWKNPAAFRRLCVETWRYRAVRRNVAPAAFRRLCVETTYTVSGQRAGNQPPSGGCVLKLTHVGTERTATPPAAFRRLCVETMQNL